MNSKKQHLKAEYYIQSEYMEIVNHGDLTIRTVNIEFGGRSCNG